MAFSSGQMAALTERPLTSIHTTSTPGPDRPVRPRVVPVSTSISTSPPALTVSAPTSASVAATDFGARPGTTARNNPMPAPATAPSMSGTAIKNSSTDAMDIATPTNNTSPTTAQGSDTDPEGKTTDQSKNSSPQEHNEQHSQTHGGMYMSAPPPAAAAVHQPKIVQTAFIHKLYNMLEDPNICHLISWSSTADSFVMSPSPDFSKVLSQYFKHTNVSSFVRQLNMYGFHKERDVFHTGNPESTLWEFKHGGGSFKRGDLNGLREIKRRASRHALVHRENNYPKAASSQPGTPSEQMHLNPESADGRLTNLEFTIHDLNARLQRTEETIHYMHNKNQALTDTTHRLLFFNQELSRAVLALLPSDSAVHRDVVTLQSDMQRQLESLRSADETEPPQYSNRPHYYGNAENAPVSPRQYAQDDHRRTTLTVPQTRGQNFYRPTVPSNLSIGSRRPYGSISATGPAQVSPSRIPPPAPPPQCPHPLSNPELHANNLARRHTSADIREHGWQAGVSPVSATAPSCYPPTPNRMPPEGQQLRESVSSYSLHSAYNQHSGSRPATPPYTNGSAASNNGGGGDTFGNWSWGSAASRSLGFKDSSMPPTRRGSMAHILNPSDTVERSDEDDDPRGDDDRKRRRR